MARIDHSASFCALMLVMPAFVGQCGAAHAATLIVGPDAAYKTIESVALAANSGDTVLITPGTYSNCAVWRADHLTIAGLNGTAQFSGTVCENKGIFVIDGNDITIRNIKFADARSTNGNGAGIREQGTNLTVEHSEFLNNQDGILTGVNPDSSIVIRDSVFDGNGACVTPEGCAHGIYIGHIAFFHIERSHFLNTRIGHDIKSRALRTEIVDNTIENGAHGTSSYLVDVPNGGTLLMTGNTLEKGPMSDNPSTAVAIGEEGTLQPSSGLVIRDNLFTNDGGSTVLVRNRTVIPAQLIKNQLRGQTTVPLVGPGTVQ
jgi:hypothetical protein